MKQTNLFLLLFTLSLNIGTAQTTVFSDDFETPQTWTIFEEIVSGNACYGDNIGEVTRSTDIAQAGTNALRVWSNKNGTTKSNHVIAAHHISNTNGITGRLRYGMWAYNATTIGLTQSSPEFSVQSTRTVGAQNLTYIAGVQYIGNQWVTDKWNIWHNGTWQTIKASEFGTTLVSNTWYYLELEFDLTTNTYVSFKIQGGGLNQTLDLTQAFQNANSGFKIGAEARNWQPSLFVTAESENLWTNCTEVREDKVYYDNVKLESLTTNVNYTTSTVAMPNPERGFYQHTETFANNYTPLSTASLSALRNGYTSSGATYTTPVTLILRVFYLENFKTSAISATYLTKMQTDFDAARTAGVKVIVRFAYTQKSTTPYGDADLSRIQSHLTQLQPLLQTNVDVIAAVQLGFVGAWGEGYYTDYFGDASFAPYQISATNWQKRIDLLTSVLSAVPSSRMVQVRYPQWKQKAIYGTAAATSVAATGGRVGHHNDCFLATYNDSGTFNNYSTGNDDTTNLKPYVANDVALNVVMGGETCETNGTHHKCASESGVADTEMKRFRYSYLNADYNHSVNNTWTPCFDAINKGLGYRFALVDGTFTNSAAQGNAVNLAFNVRNDGFATPYNARSVEFVLRNTATNARYYATVNTDPRQWSVGATTAVNQNFCLPNSIPTGNYTVLLNLPDPSVSLYNRADYSIQLANTGVWEATTGYNALNHTLAVTAGSNTCATYTTFTTSSSLPVELIDFKGFAEKQGNRLTWKLANTKDLDNIVLQKSSNGIDFKSLNNTTSCCEFLDEIPFSLSYYRLKIKDLDGTISFSKIIALQRPNTEGSKISIYPNPATSILFVENAEGQSIEILNILGQIVATSKANMQQMPVSITHLTAGIYFVKTGNDVLRFIKN